MLYFYDKNKKYCPSVSDTLPWEALMCQFDLRQGSRAEF